MSNKRELSRAEQVRARRTQSVAQAMAQNTQRTERTSSLHVITSRTGSTYVRPAQKRPERRRFNIALGLPHISLQRPALRIPRERWRPISLLLMPFLGLTIYLMWTLPYFRVSTSTVMGNHRLSAADIDTVLGLTGNSIFTVKPDEVATRLRLNYPELASAQVNVYLPNQVYVTVTERQPVILWQQGDGFTWIDSSGVAFRPRGQVDGLIPVTGLVMPPAGISPIDDPLSPPQFIAKDLVDAILLLAPNVPAGSTLTYDGTDGLGWRDTRGWNVFFGTSTRDMALKLRVYQSLVDTLVTRGRVPEYINVAYPDAPYYRMPEFAGFTAPRESE
jgi:hypothetical protein